MQEKLADFGLLAKMIADPVQVPSWAAEPVEPVAPRRPLLIGGGIAMGLGLAIALVCLLE